MDVPHAVAWNGLGCRASGFTLVELMITLSVVAVLVTGVVPSFQALIGNARTTTRANTIIGGLAMARAKSVYSGQNVVLCPSSNGQECRRSMRWDLGWIAFLDRNANGARDPGDDLLRVEQRSRGGAIITSTARTRITFRSTGTRLNPGSSAGSNTTFTVCDPRGADHTMAVTLSNTGRARTLKPAPPAKAALCPS